MNWIIAILATLSVQIKRFSKHRNEKKGSIKEWIFNNFDEMGYALIVTIILMLSLMNDFLIGYLDLKYFSSGELPIEALKPLAALIIGLMGGSIIRAIMSLTNKRLKNNQK